jgi:hypothetical protein
MTETTQSEEKKPEETPQQKKGTHWRKLRNEKYLGAWDFEHNKEYPFLIDNVKKEEIPSRNGGNDLRPVIYTKTSAKGIVLNVTNAKMIEILHGPEIEEWVNKKVVVTIRKEKIKGEMVDVIRLLNRRI